MNQTLVPWKSANPQFFLVVLLLSMCLWVQITAAGPANVTLYAPSSPGTHALTLLWSASSDSTFREYRIYRSLTASVTTGSFLVFTGATSSDVQYRDTLLRVATTYYYRVFVVDTAGVVSTGSNEVSATTLPHPFPFSDNTEVSSALNWIADAPWGLDTTEPYIGLTSWSDSPLGNYATTVDASLTTYLNLSTAKMPVLKFRTRYATQANGDFCRVEVNIGTGWTIAGYFSGSQSTWKQVAVDLSRWAGSSNVRIRFRLSTNSDATVSGGWYVDDIVVAETPPLSLGFPFLESFDDPAASSPRWSWTQWEVQTNGRSPQYLIHDSPVGAYLFSGTSGSYSNDPYSSSGMTTAGTIDLSAAVNPVLTFYQKYDLKPGGGSCTGDDVDYGRVYISTNFGWPGTWVPIYSITGSGHTASWERVELDLAAYAGSPNVRLMFLVEDSRDLNTYCGDNSGTGDGWWLDDIRVENRPAFVTIQPLSHVSMHGTTLTWNQNPDSKFRRYEIYRATSNTVSRSSQLVASVTDRAATTWRDNHQNNQPNVYYYRVYVVDTLETYSVGSNIVSAAYTVPTVLFPFTDDMESAADTANWSWGYPWGRTSAKAHSGLYSWSDSPGASYDPSTNTSLSTFVNLSGSAAPVLVFWHQYSFETNADYGVVEISTNGGSTWSAIHSVTGVDSVWSAQRIDLRAYSGSTIGLRFRVTSNDATHLDGWYLDDISIQNGVRVAAFPFTEDFENGFDRWFQQSPWGLSMQNPHSGSYAMTESPGGSYAPQTDASLLMHIDLSGADMPLMTFWTRYGTEINNDYCRVEVASGDAWVVAAYFSGSHTSWKQLKVDLTPWSGNSDVRIRFRFQSDNDGVVSDGWYVDDIWIGESPVASHTYPFLESFDDSTSAARWDWGQWEIVSDGRNSPGRIHDSPTGNYLPSGEPGSYSNNPQSATRMITAGVIDLSNAVNPVLTFYQKYDLKPGGGSCTGDDVDYGRVYVSANAGVTGSWENVYNVTGTGHTGSWERVEVNLSLYAGQSKVRLMFMLDESRDLGTYCGDNSGTGDGWWIDDIRLENRAVATTLLPPIAPTMHDVQLVWSGNMDADFARYEVYRATSAVVDRSSLLVATFDSASDTTFRDVYQVVQPVKYYYRVYVVDQLGTASFGSNIVEAAYTVPTVVFPFADDFERDSADARWAWGSYWGSSTARAHSGLFCWTDSPGASYGPNANTALTTRVNLAGSGTPVLTFWHSYALEDGTDWGYVEISADNGTTWTAIHSVTGVDTVWNQERIDLTPYVGQTIGLRFRLSANATNQFDGWYIDDVVISNGVRVASYPFHDTMENGVGSWFMDSPWSLTTTTAHDGQYSWTDSPAGNYSPAAGHALKLRINLSSAQMPMLRFWTRYATEVNVDYGRVEVNAGTGWAIAAYFSGSQSTWKEVRVDLTRWAGNSDVQIRFRLTADGGSTVSDGWSIDDVSIGETPIPRLEYPLVENFDDSSWFNRWYGGQWSVVSGGRSGPGTIHDSPTGNYLASGVQDSYSNNPANVTALATAGVVDLTNAVNPVLTFYQKYDTKPGGGSCTGDDVDNVRVYVSGNFGLPGTWSNIYNAAGYSQTSSWGRVELSLSAYARNPNVRILFVMDESRDLGTYCGDNSGTGNGWWLDDIRVGENIAFFAVADSARLEGPRSTRSVPGQPTERIYGLVYEPGKTNSAGQGVGVLAQFGVGPVGTYPNDTSWTWVNATYLNDAGVFDRYFATITAGAPGEYDYAYRFSLDNGGHWISGDLDGNAEGTNSSNAYDPANAGRLMVALRPQAVLALDTIRMMLPVSARQNWSFVLRNGGAQAEGLLGFNVYESMDGANPASVAWFSVVPERGSIPVGGERIMTVTFDATGMKADTTVTAVLLLTTNDPDRPSIVIPVYLTTVPAGATAFTGAVVDIAGNPIGTLATVEVFRETVPAGSITSDAQGAFSLYGLDAGLYSYRAVADGFYPEYGHGIPVPGTAHQIRMSRVPVVHPTDRSVNLYGSESTFNGRPLEPGTVITAVDPQGVVCGTTVVRTPGSYGFLHIYGDDPSTPSVDEGAVPGDSLQLFINEFPATAAGPDALIWPSNNSIVHAELYGQKIDAIPLVQNWNLISFTVRPPLDSVHSVLQSLAGHYTLVSGFDLAWGGARTYDPALPQFSDLEFLDPMHGYWLKMDRDDTLRIGGERFYTDHPLPLETGWNLTSYLPEPSLPVPQALASLEGAIAVVSGFRNGAQTYVPGSLFNDLNILLNGSGYWIKTTGPAVLAYQPGRGTTPAEAPAMLAFSQVTPTPWWSDYFGECVLNGSPVVAGEVIEARDPDGTVCGLLTIRRSGEYGFFHVYGDDPSTEIDEGAVKGDAISFYHNDRLIALTGNDSRWTGERSPCRFAIQSITGVTTGPTMPDHLELEQNFPNPFNPSTNIQIQNPKSQILRVGVYDLLGREIALLLNEEKEAGLVQLTWDGRDSRGRELAGGVYLYRLESGGISITRKLVLLK